MIVKRRLITSGYPVDIFNSEQGFQNPVVMLNQIDVGLRQSRATEYNTIKKEHFHVSLLV